MDVFSALQDHGFQAQGKELQSGEHSGRTGTRHYYLRFGFNILIFREFIGLVFAGGVGFVAIAPEGFLAGVEAPLHKHRLQTARIRGYLLRRGFMSHRNCYLELFHFSITPLPSISYS